MNAIMRHDDYLIITPNDDSSCIAFELQLVPPAAIIIIGIIDAFQTHLLHWLEIEAKPAESAPGMVR